VTGVKKMSSRVVVKMGDKDCSDLEDMSDFEKNSVIASEDEDTSKKKKKSSRDDKDSKNKVGKKLKIMDIVILF
jgi:hypothetical protein